MEQGELCLTAKDKVRLLPALNIPDDLLMQAIGILKDICAEGVQLQTARQSSIFTVRIF